MENNSKQLHASAQCIFNGINAELEALLHSFIIIPQLGLRLINTYKKLATFFGKLVKAFQEIKALIAYGDFTYNYHRQGQMRYFNDF